jgi:hypothetical protein
MTAKDLPLIGRAEYINLPDFDLAKVPAKVDTGADNSSIGVSGIAEDEHGVSFCFFNEGSPLYTGTRVHIPHSEYEVVVIASSFGHREFRYKVKLLIEVRGKMVRASFTLADRSNKVYPVLIGRKLLHNKFLVDVSQGEPLLSAVSPADFKKRMPKSYRKAE